MKSERPPFPLRACTQPRRRQWELSGRSADTALSAGGPTATSLTRRVRHYVAFDGKRRRRTQKCLTLRADPLQVVH